MKSKTIKLILAVSIFLASVCVSFPVVQATGHVAILTNTGYIDSSGNYQIVGEVQNTGQSTVEFIQVTATYYNSFNSIVDTRFDLTILAKIMAGYKSPFKIALLDVAKSAQVHNYSLSVTFLETSPLPIGVEITSHSSNVDANGRMHVTGQLKNTGTEKLSNPKVAATFYNKTSRVVAAAISNMDSELPAVYPNQTWSFELVLDAERTQYVSTYILTAESSQYTIIPELPPLAQLLIVIISSSILVLTTRRNFSPGPSSRRLLKNIRIWERILFALFLYLYFQRALEKFSQKTSLIYT